MFNYVLMKVPDKLLSDVASGTAKRIGAMIHDAATGQILGHVEEAALSKGINGIASLAGKAVGGMSNPLTGVGALASSVVGNIQNQKIIGQNNTIISNTEQIITQLTSLGSQIGGVAALGWVNVGISTLNLGVTVAGTIIQVKKLNELKADIQKLDSRLDSIDWKLSAIQQGVDSLNENETRKLYKHTYELIFNMYDSIENLGKHEFTESFQREIQKLLNDCSTNLSYLNDSYLKSANIVVDLDTIILFYCTYMSLLKIYSQKMYCVNSENIDINRYILCVKPLFSSNMLNKVQKTYALTDDKLVPYSTIQAIGYTYGAVIQEHLAGVTSQHKIFNRIPQKEYLRLNDNIQERMHRADIPENGVYYIQYEIV